MYMDTFQLTVHEISDHVLQIVVPTPTLPPFFATNAYLIHCGQRSLLVDVGSKDLVILRQLHDVLQMVGHTCVDALLATHYHRDHTQGLGVLQQQYGVPIYVHAADLDNALTEMPEAADVRDIPVQFDLDGLAVRVEHRPGHTHGHVHLVVPEDRVTLVGDHLIGDGSVWIGPPDGHMAEYYEALQAIADGDYTIAGPGHGPIIHDARQAALGLLHRRQQRERQIVDLLRDGAKTQADIVSTLYGGQIPDQAMWVARKTVQAHLQHLLDQRKIIRRYISGSSFLYSVVTDQLS